VYLDAYLTGCRHSINSAPRLITAWEYLFESLHGSSSPDYFGNISFVMDYVGTYASQSTLVVNEPPSFEQRYGKVKAFQLYPDIAEGSVLFFLQYT
jgi:hypothetical protein